MTFISYAQNFEDVLLWRAFRDVGRGFYIDVGAAHPDTDSVTRAFYDRGWTGINVEPVPEYFARLSAARARDTNLCMALGAAQASATFHVVAGTGLSTIDPALADQHRANEWQVREQHVQIGTLGDVCRAHAPATIHFLKIDVEGAERAVLEGADFADFRPQIVLVEATAPNTPNPTHEGWEALLLEAAYRFVWFDGLNRFYVAAEHFDELSRHFQVPVCYFDDFMRAADTEWTQRVSQAEARTVVAREQTAELLEQTMLADAAVEIAQARARDAEARALRAEQRHDVTDLRAQSSEQRAQALEARAAAAEHLVRHNEAQNAAELHRLHAALRLLQAEEAALRASTSWRLTAPLRGAVQTTRALARFGRATETETASAAPPPPAPPAAPPETLPSSHALRSLRAWPRETVHQFHSGSAVGDAITNSLLLIRTQLRAIGYRSEIFVEHCDPLLAAELRLADELPLHDDYVLILHHSMGFDAYERVLALQAPKILIYHNITPEAFFAGQPYVQQAARRGREQLAGLRDHVVSALADSEYNAIELRRLGFADVGECMLLLDLDALCHRMPLRSAVAGRPFTILFIGRIVESKGQLDLLEAYAAFRRHHEDASRLVMVGRGDGVGQPYLDRIRVRVAELGLGDDVVLTGLVSDDALLQHIADADLYVSLSQHEGFGVPLVEASVAGLPVLAWPAGATAYTLGVRAGLLDARDANHVGAKIAALARDAGARDALARAQSATLDRFAMAPQLARLSTALLRAGALPPAPLSGGLASFLASHARYTLCGHINKTYSLAAINRTLARALDRRFPQRVRLIPVEGEPTDDLAEVPQSERAAIAALAARPPHQTGPVIVITQHYPVYVPPERGDVLLALVFWEETLVPAETVALLNASFDAVLAPSHFVAGVLVDSGVSVPVHNVGYAPELDAYLALHGPGVAATDPFTFLHVSSAFPRKGLDVLLAAYARAFRAGDPVRLVVKTFPNPHNDAATQIEALRQKDPLAPAIELIDRDITHDEMLALYAEADTMVLPTRGEGFNLPAAEAMAACIPLIVTDVGGHRDFCDAQTARLVASRWGMSRSHLASPASLWAEPDTDDLAEALREAAAREPANFSRAQRARHQIIERTTPARFTDAIASAAMQTLLQARARGLRLCVVTSWDVRCGVAGYTRQLIEAMRAADPDMQMTILPDRRAPVGDRIDLPIEPCWTLGSDDISGLLGAIARYDPHAVMIQHQPGLLDWAMLGRLLEHVSSQNRICVVTLHNTMHLDEAKQEQRETALLGLGLASRVIVHTLADIERLRGFGLTDNVVLVPQGAPVWLPAVRAPELHPAKPVVIGSCGFLLPDKGIPALVDALSILRETWRGASLKLLNAHYDHPLSDQEEGLVRERIKANNLGKAVELVTEFMPFDEARRKLGRCDIIVLPYTRSKEASSAALRMALSAGPCVAVTPIPLFDEAGAAVCRLPGIDAAAIADGISALLRDRALQENLSAAAREWIAARGWPVIGTRIAGMTRGLTRMQNGAR